MLKKDVI
jgi:hypothetical protein